MTAETPTKRQTALASTVALRLDRPTDKCAAWMEAADRVCGKDATAPWLCSRHVKVAEKRWAKELAAYF